MGGPRALGAEVRPACACLYYIGCEELIVWVLVKRIQTETFERRTDGVDGLLRTEGGGVELLRRAASENAKGNLCIVPEVRARLGDAASRMAAMRD